EGGTEPYNYTWAFGDGGTAVGPIVEHAYSAAGNFTVSLAVSDSANHTAAILKSIPVASRLSAETTFAPSLPVVGERITFSGNATGGTPPYTYDWAFGDGVVGIGASVTHFYVNATRFNVTLNVTDAMGRFVVVVIEVVTGPNLAVSFRFEPSMPIAGRPVTFVPIISGGTPPYTYAWTFGDPDGSTSDEEQPTHLYGGSGLFATFRVSLQVCDSAGHCVSASQDVTLVNWVQIATIGVSVAIASILVIWFVRRFRAQRWMFKSAGQTAWIEASRFKREVAGRVRRLRNGRFRRGPESGGNR
ncbi:MAG TPA: PKD domain-containing protein, partial [Thermoplasmata archaeon]|nr:PKD domain-containing protein [Thermoplasmata archaeon]